MPFDPNLAAIRFGPGRAPNIADPASPEAMLTALAGPDRMAVTHPIPAFSSMFSVTREIADIERARRAGTATEGDLSRRDALRREIQDGQIDLMAVTFARGLDCEDGLRERLTWFWADHFTVLSKHLETRSGVSMFVEDAIRPHVAGRFADMLKAVSLHPMMLLYLDQHRSVGPNSVYARNKPERGLNENFARELIELHTLGVEGGYTQNDVRQLAELLAGVGGNHRTGFVYYKNRGEPGPETVLGRSYGRRKPKLEDVLQVLDDLAEHPATARHIGRKLAVHFVSEDPDPGLVEALADRFADSGGDLLAVNEVLLTHPAAQTAPLAKAKPPFDFILSSYRALGVTGSAIVGKDRRWLRRKIFNPLKVMGQPWQAPTGPDGWSEAADYWISPQGLAARISWAMGLQRTGEWEMPDPRHFVRTALGGLASERLVFAASAAETRGDGVGIVLAAPDFQRR